MKGAPIAILLALVVFAGFLFSDYIEDYSESSYDDSSSTSELANVEYNGTWSGTWSCDDGETTLAGNWTFTANSTCINGTINSTYGEASLTGSIWEGQMYLGADIPWVNGGILGATLWSESIARKESSSSFIAEGIGITQTGSCVWAGEQAISYGKIVSTTSGAVINLTFVPKCIENCTKIVFTQMVCDKIVFQDGTSRYSELPSDASPKWTYMDKNVVNGGRKCSIDYINGETDPYYNGDDASDAGLKGKHNGNINATMRDRPRIAQSTFTNLEAKYGKNVSKLVYEFETCAFCADGKDKGKYYRCIAWEFEQANPVGAAGGTSTAGGLTDFPTAKFKEAVDKWAKNQGFALPKK
ncbi:MAG: hypothetical protein ABIH99_05030 [Candidatus Micrarchaeota archaeon]